MVTIIEAVLVSVCLRVVVIEAYWKPSEGGHGLETRGSRRNEEPSEAIGRYPPLSRGSVLVIGNDQTKCTAEMCFILNY